MALTWPSDVWIAEATIDPIQEAVVQRVGSRVQPVSIGAPYWRLETDIYSHSEDDLRRFMARIRAVREVEVPINRPTVAATTAVTASGLDTGGLTLTTAAALEVGQYVRIGTAEAGSRLYLVDSVSGMESVLLPRRPLGSGTFNVYAATTVTCVLADPLAVPVVRQSYRRGGVYSGSSMVWQEAA